MSIDHAGQVTNETKNIGKTSEELEREADEMTEVVVQTGQENEKLGRKVVEQVEKQEAQDRVAKNQDFINSLDAKQRFYGSYARTLASGLVNILQSLDWIRNWTCDVLITDGRVITIKSLTGVSRQFATQNGILMVIRTPDGRVFNSAFKITQEPPLDYAAVYELSMRAENTMDKERGLLLDGTNLGSEEANKAAKENPLDGFSSQKTTNTPIYGPDGSILSSP